jgi:hypothetical protein
MTCGKNKGRGSMLKHREGMDSIPNIHDADQSNVRQRIRLQTTSLDCQEKELNNRLDSYDEHEFQWSERKDWKQNNFFKQQIWIGRKCNPKVRKQAMHLTSRRQTNNLTWKGFLATRQKN